MKILDFFKEDENKIEFYGAKKPKYHKEEQTYVFENDTLVCLSTFDDLKSLEKFYEVIKEKVVELLTDTTIKEYSNRDNYEGFAFLDETISLDYQESLNEQICSLSLIEAESLTLNYLLIKVMNSINEEVLIWLKLKSPIKILNNTFFYQPDNYELKFTKEGLRVDNYPRINFDLNDISFIMYSDDFYIFNKDLYQKYFNLDTYYLHQAEQAVDSQKQIISDAQLITKGNAKLIYENFEPVNSLCNAITNEEISKEKIKNTLNELSLNLEITDENKFILKKPSDLIDLILLSNGCLGINHLNDEIIKVKKPQYLIND